MAGLSARDVERDAVVRASARAGDPDRYLAALLAPRQARAGLIALAAFLGEIARIPGLVREPLMGEIRLQWWRDVIADARDGAATGSPIADALLIAIERHALPRDLFFAILEARSRELDPDFAPTEQDLERQLGDTEGTAFRLAARILGAGESAAATELLHAAGQCYGRVSLLRALPSSLAQGRSLLPLPAAPTGGGPDWAGLAAPVLHSAETWLKAVRARVPAAPTAVFRAILPVALVEPYLAALERLGPDIALEKTDISPLTRVWRLWRANALRRI